MARISEDVSRVRMYLGPAIMYGLNLITLFIIVISYMITVNPKLTLYSFTSTYRFCQISIYLVSNIMNKRSEGNSTKPVFISAPLFKRHSREYGY